MASEDSPWQSIDLSTVPGAKKVTPEDSGFRADEFKEYEAEFKKYVEENLRHQPTDVDFQTELQDTRPELAEKVDMLATWWRCAKHVVVFTGAGVSTAAGLPDYRGPEGIWTRKLRGELVVDDTLDLDLRKMKPTKTHEALARLHKAGLISHVATTNVDGLHRKAGLPTDVLSELHGNSFVEECSSCGRMFERDFVVRTATGLFEHATGRACEICAGALRDIIVNFGNTFEHVPSMEAAHDSTWVQCLKADLVVVLGSSLSVPTACDLPETCLSPRDEKPYGGRLVIVNKQRTPKDAMAAIRIFASCDDVVAAVERDLLG
eukprot:gnl/TRDRNA2_/TRDRNA2_34484_c0_seq1.p1 gnl/TRDRNA2_/TRDRNA2_34484_c0~~gnl/TRDRNA2_/TRDRNA2_34484_c0_seq1.p1  ORF type:complete len:343 (-),score=59.01 gnl/TRDRNA2_/TRDRNA2_34484_c0_seq1:68-1027(-)